MPFRLLVFTSDNFRYLTLVQRDWWWYCSDWTCERFSFWHTPGFEPRTSGSLVLHSTTAPLATSGFHLWQFQVFNSGAGGLVVVLFWLGPVRDFLFGHTGFEPWTSGSLESCTLPLPLVTSGFHLWQFQVFDSGAEGLVVVLFWLDLWEIFFLATLGFEPRTSWSLVLHSTTVPWRLVVFTSDNFRYLTLVQRDWWWYCSDWTCERFSFWPHWGLNPWDLWISSPALYHCATGTSGFHLWQFQVFNSGAEGLVVVLFLLDLWEIFFLAHTGVWTQHLLISSPALYHCAMATCGFHLWQFQVFNSGAEGLVVVLFWLATCERFSFWPHQGLNMGPLDL